MAAMVAAETTQIVVKNPAFEKPLTLDSISSAQEVRLACRAKLLTRPTAGLASGHLQANLMILPSEYAADFRLLCARNPVPCPLIAESSVPGSYTHLKSYIPGSSVVAADLDIRHDAPAYMVYHNAKLIRSHALDIRDEWTSDHIAFLIGCSFSFESALTAAGLQPRHEFQGRNVPMYRTNIPLCPAGVFRGGTYVVSMRVYPTSRIDEVREITRRYNATHGEPIAWGWDAIEQLGIESIDQTTWGDAPLTIDGRPLSQSFGSEDEVPVFWGCGVTPQEAVMKAAGSIKGTVMAHAPGYMLIIDTKDEDITQLAAP